MTTINLYAALDIGSNSIKMKVVSVDENNTVSTIEELRKNIALGKDTFNYNRIRTETMLKLCDTLNDFRKIMDMYQVKNYRAVATSALRESDNRDIVIDLIKQKTDFEVQLINGAEEKHFTYLALEEKFKATGDFREDGAVVLDIGAGSVEVSLFYNNQIQRTYSIQTGVLRLKEILNDLERLTIDYPKLLADFIDAQIFDVRNDIAGLEIENFIAIGGEVVQLRQLCTLTGKENGEINRDEFNAIYNDFLRYPLPKVMRQYGIRSDNADHFLPTLILIQRFIDMTAAERIILSNVSLRDGMVAYDCLISDKNIIARDMLDSAWGIVHKYNGNRKHLSHVCNLAEAIFKELKQVSGLNERDKLLLKISSILHEVGNYISVMDMWKATYDVIMYSDLIGISDDEVHMIAAIAKYSGEQSPSYRAVADKGFDEKSRIRVKKLSAILSLANAMDRSKGKKLKLKSVNIKKSELRIKCSSEKETLLEEWEFQRRCERFYDVFGYKPKLQCKGDEDVVFK